MRYRYKISYTPILIIVYFANRLILYALTVVEPPDVDDANIDAVFSTSSFHAV